MRYAPFKWHISTHYNISMIRTESNEEKIQSNIYHLYSAPAHCVQIWIKCIMYKIRIAVMLDEQIFRNEHMCVHCFVISNQSPNWSDIICRCWGTGTLLKMFIFCLFSVAAAAVQQQIFSFFNFEFIPYWLWLFFHALHKICFIILSRCILTNGKELRHTKSSCMHTIFGFWH